MKLHLLVTLSCLCPPLDAFRFIPVSSKAKSPTQRQRVLQSGKQDDDDDSLDEAWRQFQERRNRPVSFLTRPEDNDLFTTNAPTENSSSSAAFGVFFLMAVGCLLAIFWNGESPVIADPSMNDLEDVDSAQGRFHALTGGVWL